MQDVAPLEFGLRFKERQQASRICCLSDDGVELKRDPGLGGGVVHIVLIGPIDQQTHIDAFAMRSGRRVRMWETDGAGQIKILTIKVAFVDVAPQG